MSTLPLDTLAQPLREPLEDAARFYGAKILSFEGWHHVIERPLGMPQKVFSYQREGDLPLLSYLRLHQNRPTEVAGEKPRSYMHDCVRDEIWAYPECAGFSPDVHSYREVELLLRPENQLRLRLRGEERKWPLTVVDNVIYESGKHRLTLIGAISCDLKEIREREIKPLRNAARFFAYNWGIVPSLYLALPGKEAGDDSWIFPIDAVAVPKRYLGVFK